MANDERSVPHLQQWPEGLVASNEELTRFAAEEPAKAKLVELRFFVGLTMPEGATALGVSLATVER